MEWAYNVYYKKYGVVSNFENTIHVLYAARRVVFPQKSIHMGSYHTNQPAVKVYCNWNYSWFLYSLHFKE